jgi:nucleoid DNA-binding protein
MQELIASYLIQKKECNLPLLGHFRIKAKPAQLDIANKEIFPPSDEILYNEFADNLSPDLISYISVRKNLLHDEAERRINEWCTYAKEKLDSGEKIIFNSIGILQKDGAGNIFFQSTNGIGFYEPVHAERVIHKNAEHSVLVGDRETTSGVMNEFYKNEITEKKLWWKRWAIILASASLLFLLFYFFTHKFSETGIGNSSSVSASQPPLLHHSPK